MVEASPIASRDITTSCSNCARARWWSTSFLPCSDRSTLASCGTHAPAPAVIETILPVVEYIAPAPGVVAVPVAVMESIGTIPRSQHLRWWRKNRNSFRKCPSSHFRWSIEEAKEQAQPQGNSDEKN